MITLEQAIELATEAHKDQWRNVALYQSTQTIDEVKALHPNDKFEQTFLANVYNRSKPYITHPLAVMEMLNTDEEKIVALLHDVFEDNKQYKLVSNLFNKGDSCFILLPNNEKVFISDSIWCALHALTKLNQDWDKFKEAGVYQSYKSYIKDISLNKLATKVKIADMMHNMSESNNPKQKEKYLKALPILLKAL